MESIVLTVNGKNTPMMVEKNWNLLYVLREVMGLTGAKCGCSTGDCGACKVLVDSQAVNACLILARNAQGKKIVTIEGLSNGTKLHPIQQAFIDAGAVQCGYCTPGMVISAKAFLDKIPEPTEEQIREEGIFNNLCRCTGYVKIVDAILLAAKRMKEGREE